MRFLATTFLASTCLAASAFAGDRSFLLTEPRLGGYLFDRQSDQNGICKALGYEGAAVGSAEASGAGSLTTVIANRDGIITRFGLVTRTDGYWITKIICLNKTGVREGFRNVLVHMPRHPESYSFYSTKSSNRGVCKLTGHRDAAGAVRDGGSAVGPVVIVDSEGEVTGGEIITTDRGHWIWDLFCLD
jgi:hypothetical protein